MVIYKFLTSIALIGSVFLFQDPCYAMIVGEQDDAQKQKGAISFSLTTMNGNTWHSTNEELKEVAKLQRTKSAQNIFTSPQLEEKTVTSIHSLSPLGIDSKKSFQSALNFFSSLSLQTPVNNTPLKLKKNLQIKQQKNEDRREIRLSLLKQPLVAEWPEPDWSDDDSSDIEPKRFSLKTLNRAENIKTRMANGDSISDILAKSEDWFEKNHFMYTEATLLNSIERKGIPEGYKQKALKNPGLARELLLKAHEAGFPSATFDLLKQAIQEKNIDEAKSLLLTACKNLIHHVQELDSQNVEKLVKDIQTLVERTPELQNSFDPFKSTSLFQQTLTKKPKLNAELVQKYGEQPHTLQEIIQELVDENTLRSL